MPRLTRAVILSITAGCLGQTLGAQSSRKVELGPARAALRAHLLAQLRENGFPGVRVAISLPTREWIIAEAGHVDEAGEQPLRARHKIFSGSIGKTYVAALALKMVAQGELALDAKLSEFLGALPWFGRLPNAEQITLRMLLRHTSGVPEHVWKPGFHDAIRKDPQRHWQPAEIVEFVLDDKPRFAAGEGWSYADTNYVLLGMVIEKATGLSYYEALRKRVLEPHGLRDTVASDRAKIVDLASGRATLMTPTGKPQWSVVDGKAIVNPQFEWCGGGLACTTRDLAKWGRLLFTGDVVTEELRKAMLDGVPARTGPGDRYGLGAMILETAHGPGWGHTGIMIGALSAMIYYPDFDVAAAIQFNTDSSRDLGARPRAHLDRAVAVVLRNMGERRDGN